MGIKSKIDSGKGKLPITEKTHYGAFINESVIVGLRNLKSCDNIIPENKRKTRHDRYGYTVQQNNF